MNRLEEWVEGVSVFQANVQPAQVCLGLAFVEADVQGPVKRLGFKKTGKQTSIAVYLFLRNFSI